MAKNTKYSRVLMIIALILFIIIIQEGRKEANTLVNPNFETDDGWNTFTYNNDKFGGGYSTDWSSDGIRSLYLYQKPGLHTGASYITAGNPVTFDYTMRRIGLDVHLNNFQSNQELIVMFSDDCNTGTILGTITTEGHHIIDASYIGSRNLCFKLYENSPTQDLPSEAGVYIDNIILNPECQDECIEDDLTCQGDNLYKCTLIEGCLQYTIWQLCDYGCSNDTCNPPPEQCSDTDGGINYFVRGTMNDGLNDFPDVCVGNTLYEYWCDGNSPELELYECPIGCSNGVCLQGTYSDFLELKDDFMDNIIDFIMFIEDANIWVNA